MPHSLGLIVPLIFILPPVGLFMLWRSKRSRLVKIALSVGFILIASTAVAVATQTGLYERFREPEVPVWGYDIERDDRGNYKTKKVLPFERQIFNEVVMEMRTLKKDHSVPKGDYIPSLEVALPGSKAFEIVGERHDLDPDDVGGIYLKVALGLALKK